METLLTLFVGLTAVAVVDQFFLLCGVYVNFRRMTNQIDKFTGEIRQLMVPVKSITENLRVASANFVDIAAAAHDQLRRVETMVTQTGEALHIQVSRLDQAGRDVVERINETAQVLQDSVIKPFREVSAIIKGITKGLDLFLFRRNRSTVDQAHQDEELFI